MMKTKEMYMKIVLFESFVQSTQFGIIKTEYTQAKIIQVYSSVQFNVSIYALGKKNILAKLEPS